MDLQDGLQAKARLSECGLRLQQRLDDKSKTILKRELCDLSQEYDALCDQINCEQTKLEQLYDCCLQYEQSVTILYRWLADTEPELEPGVQSNMNKTELKVRLQKLQVNHIYIISSSLFCCCCCLPSETY